MCGIFGVIGRPSTDGLRAAAATLHHRGPDAFGEWSSAEGPIYLAHCRLSIIDLSDAGRQPLANEDGSIQVVFNGEIYNFAALRTDLISRGHHFRSKTDTEVIVHAYEEWGDQCVEFFRGIFAFGLWDSKQRRLLLGRDRIGVKPLFYSIHGQQLAFASEPRALLEISGYGRTLHIPSAVQFLQLSYTTGTDTVWRGIHRLPPGNVMSYNAACGSVRRHSYWSLPESITPRSLRDTVEQADALLEDAVAEELVGDVPVGVFLSGGIDSSLVATYAAKASPHIKSFCADFVGWDGSELADSTGIANHLETEHHACSIARPGGVLGNPESAREFFHTWDEPLGDTAIVPTWQLAQLTRQHVTVALSGDGGDEMFAGYSSYSQVQPTPRRQFAWIIERIRRQWKIGREWPKGCANDGEFFQMLNCASFSRTELTALFPDWKREIDAAVPGQLVNELVNRTQAPFRQWQSVDMLTYLVDNNLARVDRASMAHGLEVRVPMLDHRLIEFAFSLPDDVCFSDGKSKRALRELTKRYLPSTVALKRKQGFSFPLDQVVCREEMQRTIRQGALAKHGLLDRVAWDRWLLDSKSNVLNMKLWLLYVLEQWASCWWMNER